MSRRAASNSSENRADWPRYFRFVKTWHLLVLFALFVAAAIWLSLGIMKHELQSATNQLVGHSAGAARNLESQFVSLQEDFRVLVSTGTFDVYATDSNKANRDRAMVKRFFARYQEVIGSIELGLHNGETVKLELAPGNYLRSSRHSDSRLSNEHAAPSTVIHDEAFLIIEERMPPAESPAIDRVRLFIDHNRFFSDRLASYFMGQSDLWIWSLETDGMPLLLRNTPKGDGGPFGVDKDAVSRIEAILNNGLEGVDEHGILVPESRAVVSAFTPLSLGNVRMGLVFSIDREDHLENLHRLSVFLGLFFLGSLTLLVSWFAVSYTRIRESEREQAAARRRAEAADRAKSEFVAAMSHEIRTPLNGVLGYADLLMDSDLSARQRDHVEVIHNSGDHLLSILNDILDFSTISSGNLKLRMREYSPVECADDVIDMMTTAAEKQGLELRLEVRGEIPDQVVGDPGRLRQILYNLMGNGIKFTHQGTVGISMAATDEGDCWRLDFVVSDTGIGIPEVEHERLFAPFSQLDGSNTREYEGTGLGLAICSRLVESMGGKIDFESKPGAGSDFRFWIKVGKVANTNQGPSGRPLDGKTVLIVDSCASSLDILSGRIRRMGARVIQANDEALAARAINGETKIDLVMMDWHGSGGTGRTVSALLAARQLEAAPMIAITGLHLVTEPDKALFQDYLIKPVRLTSLERRLSKLLAEPAVAGSPEQTEPLRVLIAEDNLINSELMVALLEQRCATAMVASNGLETLAKLQQQDYDLVFMDVEMPGLDGIEVTRRIRHSESEDRRVHTRIVGLSAHAFHEDRKLAFQAGMDDYLTKPVDLLELDRVLEDAMNRKRGTAALQG